MQYEEFQVKRDHSIFNYFLCFKFVHIRATEEKKSKGKRRPSARPRTKRVRASTAFAGTVHEVADEKIEDSIVDLISS
jgi:hypothetical protein